MSKPIKILLFIFILIFCKVPDASAISWQYDLERAIRSAKASGKPVMVDFYTDWCGWCKKLDKDTYASKRVRNLASEFICVKVDGNKKKDLVVKYGVRGYPTTLFISSDGQVIGKIGGYAGPDVFAKNMEAVLGRVKAVDKKTSSKKKTDSDKKSKEYKKKKVKKKEAAKKKKFQPGAFELNGIMYSENDSMAIINGNVVKKGDIVGGAKVIEINEKSAKLLYQEEEVLLLLE